MKHYSFKNMLMPGLAAAVLLMGCAPRVTSDVMLSLPPKSVNTVMVYETNDSVPASARPIGKVKVTDGGMTSSYDCLYANMLALAVKRTAESGGNALHIDKHKEPNAWTSTCHRIWGTMYLMPDSLANNDVVSTLQKIEDNRDKELAEMGRKKIENLEQQRKNPSDILKVSAGPAWITSETVTSERTYKSKMGYGLGVEYEHFWRWGFGIGLNYSYFGTSFDEGFDIGMHYVGPSILYSTMIGKMFRYEVGLGLGYSYYKEKDRLYNHTLTESHLGVKWQFGLEYKLADRVAIGLQVDGFSVKMDKPEDYEGDKNEFYGIKRLEPLIGLRFYL